MANRTGNYCAFYVAEPFNQNNLGANTAKDFCYYNLLKAWKAEDSSFPFVDSHAKTYSVRDGSDWEQTLKPRLHARLNDSANVVLFLSSNTRYSRALREEIDYAINTKNLPIIVVYPELNTIDDIHSQTDFTSTVTMSPIWQFGLIFLASAREISVAEIYFSVFFLELLPSSGSGTDTSSTTCLSE